MRTDQTCGFGARFMRRGCGRQAVSDCVYCARAFCAEHGERGEHYMDVCSRKRCREKLRDLRAHEEWRARVEGSNRISVCAFESCDSRLRHQCSRCQMLFCAEHVKEQRIRDNSQQPSIEVLALICRHCAERRKTWD